MPAIVATMTHFEMRADFDRPNIRDLKFTQAAFAAFPCGTKWTLMAGLFYTTRRGERNGSSAYDNLKFERTADRKSVV